MMDLKGLRVVVAGAGAIGSAIAVVLARRGALVTLTDPARVGDNASGVAAGMLAPASEALLDSVSASHFPLLLRARDAWEELVQGLAGAPALDRSGAILQVDDPAGYLRQAEAAGMSLAVIDDAEARRRAPGLGERQLAGLNEARSTGTVQTIDACAESRAGACLELLVGGLR